MIKNTSFNGVKIFEDKSLNIQTGPNSGDSLSIKLSAFKISKEKEISIASTNLKMEDTDKASLTEKTSWSKSVKENGWKVTNGEVDADGKLQGYAEIEDGNGKIIARGNFQDDKLNGYAKLYKGGEVIRSGNFKDNILDGWGEVSYEDGSQFRGNFINGEKNGWGTLEDSEGNILHKGEWVNDMVDGTDKPNLAPEVAPEGFGKVESDEWWRHCRPSYR